MGSLVTRLFNFGRALAGFDAMKLRATAHADSGRSLEVIREMFCFANGFLAPIQVEEEIVRLYEDVTALRPARVLEIGTSMGGTLFLWCRAAAPDAIIVSVDLPGGPNGGGYSKLRTPLYRRFAGPMQTLHLLRADSHASETLERVQAIFGNDPVDFLFIDGDHSYEGVKRDWDMYSRIVRPGGLIAFHDIALSYEGTNVKRLWDEIAAGYETREYAYHPQKFYGIGVLTMPMPLRTSPPGRDAT